MTLLRAWLPCRATRFASGSQAAAKRPSGVPDRRAGTFLSSSPPAVAGPPAASGLARQPLPWCGSKAASGGGVVSACKRTAGAGSSSAKFRCNRGRLGAHNRWQPTGRCTAPRFGHRVARDAAAQQCDASSQRQVPGAMLLRCRWLRLLGSLERPCSQAWSTDTMSSRHSKQRSRAKKADGADHRSVLVGQQLSATLRGTLHGRHSADSGTPCGEPRTGVWRQQHGFQQSISGLLHRPCQRTSFIA